SWSPSTRARRSSWSCPPTWSSPSRRPSRACRATAPAAAPSPPASRPAARSRSPCSSTRATRSASAPPRESTRTVSEPSGPAQDAGRPAPRPTGLPHPTREGAQVEFERTIPAPADRLHGRSRDRVRAIDVLFEADAKRAPVLDVLQGRPQRSRELVELYAPHAADIDEDLATHSRDWPLDRMPAVDRAILRLGAAEVLHGEDTAGRGVIIGEYTKIAEVLSTDDSPRFVNGLLQRLVEVRGLLA